MSGNKKTALHKVKRNWVQGHAPAGGGEENRTPVRKPIPTNFYECILLLRKTPVPLHKGKQTRLCVW